MKLLFCPECQDVLKLQFFERTCRCGSSWGLYHEDGLHATIGGSAVPIGFSNPSFCMALLQRPEAGMGERFEAFVIPVECPTVELASDNKHYGQPEKLAPARAGKPPSIGLG